MISTALAVEAGLRLSRHLHKMRHSS
jgi:hypothetical protein